MMATYEAVVYVLTKHYRTGVFYSENGNGKGLDADQAGYQQEES